MLTETFGGYAYDPSYDAFETYLDPDFDSYQEDEDEGRPIELYGVGMRNGFHAFAWPDGTASEAPAFGSGNSFAGEGGSGKSERLVFAAAADGSDVSNNVDSLSGGVNGFDPTPFSVAKLVRDDSELAPGEIVAARTQWVSRD